MVKSDPTKNVNDEVTTAEKIAEAEQFLKCSLEVGLDAAYAEFEAAHRAEFEAAIAQEDAVNFQQLLTQCGGNYETLAIKLHLYIRKQSRKKKQEEQSKATKQKAGRPAERWGAENAGKIMAATIIDAELGKMRAEGIPKPKIKDAIARVCEIPAAKRLFRQHVKKINGYAVIYSQVKAMKKTRNKL